MKLMPRSIAARTMRMAVFSSTCFSRGASRRAPMAETRSPVLPRVRYAFQTGGLGIFSLCGRRVRGGGELGGSGESEREFRLVVDGVGEGLNDVGIDFGRAVGFDGVADGELEAGIVEAETALGIGRVELDFNRAFEGIVLFLDCARYRS